jgi:hypothetical protein
MYIFVIVRELWTFRSGLCVECGYRIVESDNEEDY